MSSIERGVTTRAIVTGKRRVTSSTRTLESGIAPTTTGGVRQQETALTTTPKINSPMITKATRFPSRAKRRTIVGRGVGLGRFAVERRCFFRELLNAI
jgi:hypothetical protein